MRRAVMGVVMVAMLGMGSLATAGGRPSGAALKMMQQADALYAKRVHKGMADKAIEAYQQVLAVDDTLADAYWKVARVYYWKGSHAGSDAKAAAAYREGIEFAKLGVEADDSSVGAHFWLGTLYGAFGEVKGVMQSLHLIAPMKKEMERALKLDDTYEWGGTYRVLCRLYAKLPGFKGGDITKSIAYGRKAVKAGPTHPMNYLFLAESLIQADKKDEAKVQLQKVIDMPPLKGREPECKEYKATAKKLLATLS